MSGTRTVFGRVTGRAARNAGLAAALLAATLGAAGSRSASRPADADALAADVAKWKGYLATHASTDELWVQVKENMQPALAHAADALAAGRRFLALQRLASARVNVSAWAYVEEIPEARRKDDAAFEAEWVRMGEVLRSDLAAAAPGAFAAIRPAAVRAVAEAAQPQIKGYYDASLEYGRSTMAQTGLFYIGAARAQRELVALCRRIGADKGRGTGGAGPDSKKPAPPVRALSAEIDALEGELLAAYRPPAAIDKHPEFIAASSVVNETRELDVAGLRHGALLRYLQSVLRFTALSPATPAPAADIEKRLADARRRLDADAHDHSIARIFVELAEQDLASPEADKGPATAQAVVDAVLPRYFAALEPAAQPARASAEPVVTVTLVRWPYT